MDASDWQQVIWDMRRSCGGCLQELQRLSQQAVTSEVALQQVRHDVQQITAQQQQLSTRLEVSKTSCAVQREPDLLLTHPAGFHTC